MAGNSHTIICLRASPGDEQFILPYMEPAVEKGNIVNLAPYHFYFKMTTDQSEFASSGMTVPLKQAESVALRNEILANSRAKYGTPRRDIEKYLDGIFSAKTKATKFIKKARKPEKAEP